MKTPSQATKIFEAKQRIICDKEILLDFLYFVKAKISALRQDRKKRRWKSVRKKIAKKSWLATSITNSIKLAEKLACPGSDADFLKNFHQVHVLFLREIRIISKSAPFFMQKFKGFLSDCRRMVDNTFALKNVLME